MINLRYTASETSVVRGVTAQGYQLLGKKWILIGLLLVVGCGQAACSTSPLGQAAGAFAVVTALALAGAWLRTFRVLRQMGRQRFAQMDDKVVQIQMDDASFEVSSSIGSQKAKWQDVTRRVQTDEFLILYTGKLALACLPREALTAEAVELIARRVSM